ncbi:hypothetical protein GS432_12295 [Rhodococcus hoagii]|nr:hypothetical protein [Prescottella equi]
MSTRRVDDGVGEFGCDETRERDGDASAGLSEAATTEHDSVSAHSVDADVRRHRVVQGAEKVHGAGGCCVDHEVLAAPILVGPVAG